MAIAKVAEVVAAPIAHAAPAAAPVSAPVQTVNVRIGFKPVAIVGDGEETPFSRDLLKAMSDEAQQLVDVLRRRPAPSASPDAAGASS